jgi:hypothetical protein
MAASKPVVEQPVVFAASGNSTDRPTCGPSTLDLRGLRILVLVDHVLVGAMHSSMSLLAPRALPKSGKGGEILSGVAVKHMSSS